MVRRSQPDTEGLIRLVEVQRDAIKAIATGTEITESAEREYKQRSTKIGAGLRSSEIDNPFQWPDLANAWAWARTWTTYSERRHQIDLKIGPVLDLLRRVTESGSVDDWGGETRDPWADIEERLRGLREEMDSATTLDEYQDVGRRGREILIAAVNEVFDDTMAPSSSSIPKAADAKARFVLALEALEPLSAHKELRRLMKAAWDLAQTVTHSDSITRVDAFASAQSTVLLVRTLSTIRREVDGSL